VVDRRHRHPLVGAHGRDPAPWREGAAAGPVAVRSARRRRARGDLQPAAAASLPSEDRAHRAALPRFSRPGAAVFRETGAFPPQHLIVLRREAWQAHRWIAPRLTEAFGAANDYFTAAQKSFPYATPWLEAELEDTAAVMGEDFHPYGLEQ